MSRLYVGILNFNASALQVQGYVSYPWYGSYSLRAANTLETAVTFGF